MNDTNFISDSTVQVAGWAGTTSSFLIDNADKPTLVDSLDWTDLLHLIPVIISTGYLIWKWRKEAKKYKRQEKECSTHNGHS